MKEPGAATDDGEVKLRATSEQEPCAATEGGDVTMQCAAESEMKRDGRETMVEEVNSVKRPLQDTTKNNLELRPKRKSRCNGRTGRRMSRRNLGPGISTPPGQVTCQASRPLLF
jgi:hypothetical protein